MSAFCNTKGYLTPAGIRTSYIFIIVAVLSSGASHGQSRILDSTMHYLRNGDSKEWAVFPTTVNDKQLSIRFEMVGAKDNLTLSLRQFDVKQNWRILINDQDVGGLIEDEKDMITYFDLPARVVREGTNELVIKPANNTPDDIRIGSITLYTRPLKDVLSDASISVSVIDGDSRIPIPSRITITDNKGILQTLTTSGTKNIAARPGHVYTSTGEATISLPAGRYKLYAGRGFEYSIDSVQVELKYGDNLSHTFQIKREVETAGWISSDTHIHTFTYSRHGDATIEERAITIAGEGIELPIMTDHNQNIDISAAAKSTGVIQYFTPVTGNEVTTKVGHFNVFQTDSRRSPINSSGKNWDEVAEMINNDSSRLAIILNHARDIHNGFRPFDPSHHISSAGTSTLGWIFPANAMEVINSGSQQSDIMTLFNDWFGMINHGQYLTPVGSSDSHDVSRFTLGQGRTYIKSNDGDVSKIDIANAVNNFVNGKVLVSLGLLTKITVGGSYGPGDLCPRSKGTNVSVEVFGPSWADAKHVSLYMNGVKLKDEKIPNSRAGGLKWRGQWTVSLPEHDVFLVAIAEGDGRGMPYWPINEPYQPMSIEWTPKLIGSTGAVWIDGDGDGIRSSAYDYALKLLKRVKNDPKKLMKFLSSYHESISTQAAAQLWKNGTDLNGQQMQHLLKDSNESVKRGFTVMVNEAKSIRR